MENKKSIPGHYTAPGGAGPLVVNTDQTLFNIEEKKRQRAETLRNTQRHFDYNARRKLAGLPELPYADYLARQYGTSKAIAKARQCIGALKVQHRDNVVLMTR